MNSNKNILSLLVGLSACYFLVSKFGKTEIKENFLNHPRTLKIDRVQQVQGVSQSLPSNAVVGSQNQQFGVQQMANVGISSNIRQSQRPAPSIVSGNVIEPYTSQATNQRFGCRTSGGNGAVSANISQQQPQNIQISDSLPVQAMGSGNGAVLNNLGELSAQPIIYDRYVYANQRSRNYSQGDPIRGDLPIVPECNSWFRPIANPQTDLRDGAVQSMIGSGETSNELLALRSAAAGGLLSVGAGASGNTRVQNNPYGNVQVSGQLSAAGGVQYSLFP